MLGAVRNGISALVGLALPRCCASCGRADEQAHPLCRSCGEALLELVAQAYCPHCGTTVAPGLKIWTDSCAHCPNPVPRFDRVVRVGSHRGPLAQIIRAFKFTGQHHTRRWLGQMLAQRVSAEPELVGVQVVQAVPLHWIRRFRRGYNQADVLARVVGRELGLPVADELVRKRNTPPQVHLSRSRRLDNVRGAFAVRPGGALDGTHVLLIDDVTTTGATASEAARALLQGGATRVSLAVLAKADPPMAFEPRHPRSTQG